VNPTRDTRQLNWLLAWAVVFCDIGLSVRHMDAGHWAATIDHLSVGKSLSWYELLVGFGAAWLAFSGLESTSQISPAISYPVRQTIRIGMVAVMLTIVITSPTLSTFNTVRLMAQAYRPQPSPREADQPQAEARFPRDPSPAAA
jgi:amino acid transporter